MKLPIYIGPEDVETTVFDNTPCGRAVLAERSDEPGDESRGPESAGGAGGNNSPGRHANIARILGGDTEGDWAWKPARDEKLGKNFVTFHGVPPSFAESRPRGPEPCARFYGTPESMMNESAEDFQAKARAGHKAAGDYRVWRVTA